MIYAHPGFRVHMRHITGWSVTTFNRGLSGADLDGVEVIRGDRYDTADLATLETAGPWDAVIDCAGFVPRNVLAVSRSLRERCGRYLFVSTVSVYEGWPAVALSEESQVLECPIDAGSDFGPADIKDGPTRYGRLKAGCEAAVVDVFGPNASALVRLGVVLGPGEYVGRLPWWLGRISRGGRVIAPGDSGRTIQPIDVRDVARFGTKLIESEVSGALNVVAPDGAATFGGLLRACRDATGSDAEFVWVPDQELLRLGVRQWSELPLWRTMPGVWQVDAARARDYGLLCRPIRETAEDTWQWMQHLGGGGEACDRSAEIGLGSGREQEIFAVLD